MRAGCRDMAHQNGSRQTRPRTVSPVVVGQLIFGMALFGTTTPISKIVGENFPVFTAAFMRMAIAAVVLLPFVLAMTSRFAEATRRDWIVTGAIALFGMVGFTTAMLLGMRMTSGVIGATIMSSTPAVTALAAVVFLGAAMNWLKAGALSLSVAGVVAINLLRTGGSESQNHLLLGAALVGVAVCLEAAYTLLSRKLSDGMSSPEVTLAASLIAAVGFVALAFFFDPAPFDFSGGDAAGWTALLFFGIATGGLAPVIWYTGVRQAPGALVASAMAVMPLSALSLSYVLLGEAFHWSHLIGFGLVFIGLLLMVYEHLTGHHDETEISK
jgi:drug/metabolite transporter (DMT)-like permease